MPTLFSGGAKAPTVAPTAVAPVANQGQVAQAQQNQLTSLMSRSGRQSTILTDNTNKFGG